MWESSACEPVDAEDCSQREHKVTVGSKVLKGYYRELDKSEQNKSVILPEPQGAGTCSQWPPRREVRNGKAVDTQSSCFVGVLFLFIHLLWWRWEVLSTEGEGLCTLTKCCIPTLFLHPPWPSWRSSSDWLTEPMALTKDQWENCIGRWARQWAVMTTGSCVERELNTAEGGGGPCANQQEACGLDQPAGADPWPLLHHLWTVNKTSPSHPCSKSTQRVNMTFF